MTSRVALVAGPDPGHCFPVIAVARALQDAGHEVVVLSGDDRATDVTDAGLSFLTLPLEWPDERHADLGERLWEMPGRLAQPTADVLATFGPDVVVVDTLTTSGAFAAELLGVPWVELIPHHLPDADPAIPPVGLGRHPTRNPLRRLGDRRMFQLAAPALAAGEDHRARVRARLGLTGTGRPALRLVASLPSLEHPRSRWPADTHLVGPLDHDPPWEPLEPPPGREPLVVVADSSASTVPWRLGASVLAALRNTGVRVVVVTREELEAWPTRCTVGWGPHGPLLDQADVAVTPGGAGVLGKAFLRGVPVVVVPIHGDQIESAARVEHAGAGLRVPTWRRSRGRLRRAVLRVLADDRHRAAAERLRDEARALGPTRAADLVAAVAAGKRPIAYGPQRRAD